MNVREYYSRHTLAETCGISVSQIDRHIRAGTGALPFETPPENVRLIREYVA